MIMFSWIQGIIFDKLTQIEVSRKRVKIRPSVDHNVHTHRIEPGDTARALLWMDIHGNNNDRPGSDCDCSLVRRFYSPKVRKSEIKGS